LDERAAPRKPKGRQDVRDCGHPTPIDGLEARRRAAVRDSGHLALIVLWNSQHPGRPGRMSAPAGISRTSMSAPADLTGGGRKNGLGVRYEISFA
jgi:hypothetical protein